MNPENLNRCFVMGIDESEEQTRMIHELQRKNYTLQVIYRQFFFSHRSVISSDLQELSYSFASLFKVLGNRAL